MLLLGTILLFIKISFASDLVFDQTTIQVKLPKTWQFNQDIFGFKHVAFSPKENGQRSNISFTFLKTNTELSTTKIHQSQIDYEKQKLSWSKKIDAQILSFTPYLLYKNSNNHFIHSKGVQYSYQGQSYSENTYAIECAEHLYYLKSLVLIENKNHLIDIKKMINQFDCKENQ